jgi:hypothetical protein
MRIAIKDRVKTGEMLTATAVTDRPAGSAPGPETTAAMTVITGSGPEMKGNAGKNWNAGGKGSGGNRWNAGKPWNVRRSGSIGKPSSDAGK